MLKDHFIFLYEVNYRGSLGFGKDSIDSLPGRVGTQDIGDVHVSDVFSCKYHIQ